MEVVRLVGRFTAASNATFLGEAADGSRLVYKPIDGERPLWDFESGTLAAREVLTHAVSEAMGIGIVPPTSIGLGPYGPGVLQEYLDSDPDFDVVDAVASAATDLWPIATLDIVCNNADRKLTHILTNRETGRFVAIDHGLTFHPDDKLRTVLWTFSGLRVPDGLLEALRRLQAALDGDLGVRIVEMLGEAEHGAITRRCSDLLLDPHHPQPPEDRPALPWPL